MKWLLFIFLSLFSCGFGRAQSEVVEFPDVEAQFPGGREAMEAFIEENLRYPEKAKENEVQGKVYLSFVVGKNGDISGINVEFSFSELLSKEAIRLLESMPKWVPGEVNDQQVASRYRLPINFFLKEE